MQNEVKNSANRQKKAQLIEEYVAKVEKSKSIVFANFQGLTHLQLEAIKKSMRKMDAEFIAAKNTLLLRALEGKVDVTSEKEKFTQPTAALFIYNDIVEPLKSLAKTIKELTLPVVKFGILDGKIISDKEVAKLATIAPMPVLRAQLLGQMMSPVSGLHRSLNWNLQKLVITLNAIKEKKA